jgi:lysozyme
MKSKIFSLIAYIIKSKGPEGEGCALRAYRDENSKYHPWTIGYGCTGPNIKEGTIWTQEKADAELQRRIEHAYSDAVSASPVLNQATDGQTAAITDFVFNVGLMRYYKSTLKVHVDNKDWSAVALELRKWVHGENNKVLPGLVARREAEIKLLNIKE